MLAATSIAMILSPFFNRTPPRLRSFLTKRGFVNCTGETKRRNSSTARFDRLKLSAGEPQSLFQIAFHRREASDHAQKANGAGEPSDGVRPSQKPGSVNWRQA